LFGTIFEPLTGRKPTLFFAMSSKLTQIALDFGQEPQPQPAPSPVGNGAGEEAVRPYLTADGVRVRVKSLKQPVVPPAAAAPVVSSAAMEEMPSRPAVKVVNGDLFGMAEAAVPAQGSAEVVVGLVEESVVETPVPLEKAAIVEVVDEAIEMAVEAVVEAAVEDTVVEVEANEVAANGVPAVEPVAEVEPPEEVLPRRRTPAGKSMPKGPSKRGRKSLKEVAAEASLIEIPADEVLFSKQYYTMGEVSEMFHVNQSLLRFWETEFDILQPKKNKKGDRYFRPTDIKNLHLIYHLLRQKKYTIEGAKEFLKKNKKADERFEVIQRLQQIKAFLLEWKAQL
jgi:DNA-binding transcriptional MerR regulator